MSERQRRRRRRALVTGLGYGGALAVAVAVPLFVSGFRLHTVTLAVVYAIAALGMIFLVGEANELSLAGAGFFAIGAYGTELIASHTGLGWFTSLALALLLAAVVGGLLAVPAMRLEHIYLAVATLGFVLVVERALTGARDVTGGAIGIRVRNLPEIGSLGLGRGVGLYGLAVASLFLAVALARRIRSSRWGRAMRAMRDSKSGARAVGIRLERTKVDVFVVSSVYLALSGALYALVIGYLAPSSFGVFRSIEFVIAAVIGGSAMLGLGAVAGGFFIAFVPEFLARFGDAQIALYGIVLMAAALRTPLGISGFVHALVRRLQVHREGSRAEVSG